MGYKRVTMKVLACLAVMGYSLVFKVFSKKIVSDPLKDYVDEHNLGDATYNFFARDLSSSSYYSKKSKKSKKGKGKRRELDEDHFFARDLSSSSYYPKKSKKSKKGKGKRRDLYANEWS